MLWFEQCQNKIRIGEGREENLEQVKALGAQAVSFESRGRVGTI